MLRSWRRLASKDNFAKGGFVDVSVVVSEVMAAKLPTNQMLSTHFMMPTMPEVTGQRGSPGVNFTDYGVNAC